MINYKFITIVKFYIIVVIENSHTCKNNAMLKFFYQTEFAQDGERV